MKSVRKKAISVTKLNFAAVSQAAWAKAQLLGEFGYAEVSDAVCISIPQATKVVQGWIKEGALEVIQTGKGASRALWRVRPDFVRPDPAVNRTPEDNIWTALRRLRSATPTDLAAHATTDVVVVTREYAAEYCRALLDGGYLTVARRAAPAMGREAIYRLVDVTGVHAPVLRRMAAIFDPNTGEARLIGQFKGGVE